MAGSSPFAASAAAIFIAAVVANDAVAADQRLPEIQVLEQAERADGPVDGYRATRSSTATKTDTPLKDVPASITVVPSQLIEDQAMKGMGDVFRYVPGVLMHQGEGNRDQIVIRGISTTADFYLNGVRDDAQIFRDLYNIERVEVLKGPEGMIFGRGGAGGVVNRVTKQPAFERIGEATLTLGSFDQRRSTLDVGNKVGETAAYRINAMAEGSNDFVNGVDLRRWAANPAFTYFLNDKTSVTLDYEHLHDGRVPNRGVPSLNGGPLNSPDSLFFGNAAQSTAHSYVDGFAAVLEHEFNSDMRVKNTFHVTHYDKFYQNVYPGSAATNAGTLNLAAYNNANQRTNTFNQTDFITKLATGTIKHTLLTGMELGQQNSDNLRNTGFFGASTSITVRTSNPFAIATVFKPNGTDANNNVTADVIGLYVQDQVEFTQQWKAVAGVRYDWFKANLQDRRTLVTPMNLAQTAVGWSPRAGLIWQPTSAQTYYVSYSYAFLPSAEQLGLTTNTSTLDPETATNYEAGARWDLRPKLTLATAVFETLRNNVKSVNPASPGTFVQTGEQRVRGAEISLQGDVRPDWHVFGGYAYTDARVVQPFNSNTTATTASLVPAGNKVGLVPENTLSFWNKLDFNAGWAAGLGVIYQGAAYTSFTNTVKLPAFTRIDTAAYYTFAGGKTRVQFNVENLLNKKYWPTVDGDNNISVGAPVNARLTLTTSF